MIESAAEGDDGTATPSEDGLPGAALLAHVRAELPLRIWTPDSWGRLAADDLPTFLGDHAVCEQQAASFGLSLIGHYPEDEELVRDMGALAAEEVAHLRRVATLLHKRGHRVAPRRANPWVQSLHRGIERQREDLRKADRLFVGALIEARSCERFTCLMAALGDRDPEVTRLLEDLGPAEKRHWRLFHRLARRELEHDAFDERWNRWLDREVEASRGLGVEPRVHG